MAEAALVRAVPPTGAARLVWDAAARVADPEIPVLTLEDMGILRAADLAADGLAVVQITPTYCGCPAMDAMAQDVKAELAAAGFPRSEVRLVWSPAWTTDWMTDLGRAKLEEFGIAPPCETRRTGSVSSSTPLMLRPALPRCPRCHGPNTELVSRFGSTACKSLRRCTDCGEPFDHFKELT